MLEQLTRVRKSLLGRSAAHVFGSNMVGTGSQLMLAVYISLVFSAEGKGIYTLLTAGSALIAIALSCGLNNALVYYRKKNRISNTRCLRLIVYGCFAVGFIAGGMLWSFQSILWRVFFNELPFSLPALLFVVFNAPLALLNIYLVSYSLAVRDLRTHFVLAGLLPLTVLIGTFVAVEFGRESLETALAVLWGINFVFLSILLVLTHLEKTRKDGSVCVQGNNSVRLGEIASYGLRGHLGVIGNSVSTRLDIFIIAAFVTPEAVGVYSIAKIIYQTLMTIPQALNGLVFGALCERSAYEAVRFTGKVSKWVTSVLIVFAIPAIWVGPNVVLWVFGDAFADARAPLIVLTLSAVLMGSSSSYNSLYMSLGRPDLASWIGVIGGVVRVTLTIILVIPFSITGAAVSNAAAALVTYCLRKAFVPNTSPES